MAGGRTDSALEQPRQCWRLIKSTASAELTCKYADGSREKEQTSNKTLEGTSDTRRRAKILTEQHLRVLPDFSAQLSASSFSRKLTSHHAS